MEAAEYAGFFTLVDHGILKEEIEAQFSISKTFFDLPAETKGKTPHDPKTNNGWEYMVSLSTILLGSELVDIYFPGIGPVASQHRYIRPEGVTLAPTQFRLAK